MSPVGRRSDASFVNPAKTASQHWRSGKNIASPRLAASIATLIPRLFFPQIKFESLHIEAINPLITGQYTVTWISPKVQMPHCRTEPSSWIIGRHDRSYNGMIVREKDCVITSPSFLCHVLGRSKDSNNLRLKVFAVIRNSISSDQSPVLGTDTSVCVRSSIRVVSENPVLTTRIVAHRQGPRFAALWLFVHSVRWYLFRQTFHLIRLRIAV